MIDSTNRFLSWALRSGGRLPRIPRRRVERGGFAAMLRCSGGRALIERFWERLLG